jgi:RHS repeat-associated protein
MGCGVCNQPAMIVRALSHYWRVIASVLLGLLSWTVATADPTQCLAVTSAAFTSGQPHTWTGQAPVFITAAEGAFAQDHDCWQDGLGGCQTMTFQSCADPGPPTPTTMYTFCTVSLSGGWNLYPLTKQPPGTMTIQVDASAIPCQNWVTAIPPQRSSICSKNCFNDPINPSTGGMYMKEEDVDFKGVSGAPSFSRYYNSADQLGVDGVPGWRHSYSRSVIANYATLIMYTGQSPTTSALYDTAQDACNLGFATIQASVPTWTTASATYNNGTCVISTSAGTIGTIPIDTYVPSSSPYQSAPPTEYDVVRDDGQILRFTLQNGVVNSQPGVTSRLAVQFSGLTVTGYTVTDDDDNVEVYNALGVLQSITSRAGVVQTVSYDSTGLFSGVSDSFGDSLTVARNTQGSVASVTLNGGASVQYGYDAGGHLIQVTKLDGTTKQYVYGDTRFNNAVTSTIDENGTTFATWTYDAQERATATQEAGGVYAGNLVYNSDGSTTTTDALGAVRTFGYTRVGDINGVTGISGSQCASCQDSAATTYDIAGFKSSSTDYNGNVTCYANDPARGLELVRVEGFAPGSTCPSNLASYTPASGTAQRKFTTVWDANFREPDSITEAGSITSFTYDASGNVLTKTTTDTSTTPNVSRTWSFTYNSFGQVLTAKGPRTDLNATTTYAYYTCLSGAQCGRLSTVTDALGNVTTINAYNAFGQPLSITDPNGVNTTLTFDAQGRPTSRQVAGETTLLSYYATGLPQRVTLPDSSYLQYGYDPAHRLNQVADSLGNSAQLTLDALGNATAQNVYDSSGALHRTHTRVFNALSELYQDIDSAGIGAGAVTTFAYDGQGNAISVNAPLGHNSTYAYDSLNRLMQVTDPVGSVATVAYDANDHVLSLSDPRTLATSYGYDGFGEPTLLGSPDTGVTSYTYDSAGNLGSVTDGRGAQRIYSYDPLNRVTQMVAQIAGVTDQTLSLGYDAGSNGKGHLTSAGDSHQSLSWTYDAVGRVIGKVQTVGTASLTVGYGFTNGDQTSELTPSGQTVTYSYNSNHEIAGIAVNGTAVLTGVTYDPFGPATGWTWGNGTATSRSYSLDGWLTELSSAGTSAYTYNEDGSINSRTDSATTSYSVVPGTTTVSVASGSNQIASTTGTLIRTYAYDGAGNTTGNGGASFAYDGANRLVGVSQGINTTSFIINALGQRVSKSSAAGTTLFAYDESGHLIGEYGGAGNLIEETVWLGDIPIATLRPDPNGGIDVYYVHADHLNSPRRVSRPIDNAIVWTWTSDPFGNGFVDQNPDGDGQYFSYNLRFPGQYYDVESGLNYNYRRDYDPLTGRYIESDPVGLKGGSYSTYAYDLGNPISNIDPLGLASCLFFDCPSLNQGFVNAVAGFGDGIVSGATLGFVKLQNIRAGGGVNECDPTYRAFSAFGKLYAAATVLGKASQVAVAVNGVTSTIQATVLTAKLATGAMDLTELSEATTQAQEISMQLQMEQLGGTIEDATETALERGTRAVGGYVHF